jgi:hypothetical protein
MLLANEIDELSYALRERKQLDKQMLSLVPLQQTPPGMHTLTLASN